jgi:hypothetical protein
MDDRQTPRLRVVDRTQLLLRPVIFEQLIAEDHPARAVWEFVGRLDLTRYAEQVHSAKVVRAGRRWIRSCW